ncbi:MAG: hypothetical protein CVV47_10240 [Spirochaetae bacterium HGW-Spirochaetae-3]|jgi:hypothetical protein|nr:MAG: hypothetical protein CVV47_10240 [Spirochaetae bacterium HGW-Spirochaetae-3]
MRIIRRFLVALHLLVGVGAMAGGLAAILDPTSPLGMPADALVNAPFDTYLIPGLLLFGLIGLGNITVAALTPLKRRWLGYASGAMGCVLMGWILVQCVMLEAVVALHVIFFCLGAVQGCLALALLAFEGLWPGTWAARALARLR